jgi:hypothetical protein
VAGAAPRGRGVRPRTTLYGTPSAERIATARALAGHPGALAGE